MKPSPAAGKVRLLSGGRGGVAGKTVLASGGGGRDSSCVTVVLGKGWHGVRWWFGSCDLQRQWLTLDKVPGTHVITRGTDSSTSDRVLYDSYH